jgi:hypothetical protein
VVRGPVRRRVGSPDLVWARVRFDSVLGQVERARRPRAPRDANLGKWARAWWLRWRSASGCGGGARRRGEAARPLPALERRSRKVCCVVPIVYCCCCAVQSRVGEVVEWRSGEGAPFAFFFSFQ